MANTVQHFDTSIMQTFAIAFAALNDRDVLSPTMVIEALRVGAKAEQWIDANQIFGYKKTYDDGPSVAFTAPQGQRFELQAEGTQDKQFYPLEGTVAGFEVEDFDSTATWLKDNNYQVFPEGIGNGSSGTKWAHFRGQDGNVYEFVHHPAIATNKPE